MEEKDKNKFIVINKELYEKYGLSKSAVLQILIDNNGEFMGNILSLKDQIVILGYATVNGAIKDLIDSGIIRCRKIMGWSNKYTIKDFDKYYKYASCNIKYKNKNANLDKLPDKVKGHLQRIKELREEKFAERK